MTPAMKLSSRLHDAGIRAVTGGSDQGRYASSGFQLLAPHLPAVVAFPINSDQVAEAVRIASVLGMPFSVTNTGHGRRHAQAGGLLISLAEMSSVRIDPTTQRVRIGGGARWGSVIARTAPVGLMVPHGSAPGVGVVGYLLGGGYSIYGRTTGLAANAVRSLTLVAHDGNTEHLKGDALDELLSDAWRNPAQPGIVTEVELDANPAGSLTAGGFFVADDDARALLDMFPTWTESLPETITSSLGLMRYPDREKVPEKLRNRMVAHLRFTAVNDHESAIRAMSSLGRGLRPVDQDIRRMNWSDSGEIYKEPDSPRSHVGDNVLTDFTPDLDSLWDAVSSDVDERIILDIRHFGGQLVNSVNGWLTSPGEWMVALMRTAEHGVPRVHAELRQQIHAAVPVVCGSAANFSYGPAL